MKSLVKYIDESTKNHKKYRTELHEEIIEQGYPKMTAITILDEYDEDLEFDENDNLKTMYLIERYSINADNESINEKYGTYPGQVELADMLAKRMYNNWNKPFFSVTKEDIEKENIEGAFYKKLIVKWKNSINYYDPEESNFDEELKLFDTVTIYVSRVNQEYKEIAKTLLHELTHAWQDYCFRMNGKSMNDIDYYIDVTKKNINDASKNVKYSSRFIKKYVNEITYFLNNHEQNAFISEFKAEIHKLKDSDIQLDYNTFNEMVHRCDTFKEINKCKNRLSKINGFGKEYQETFAKLYCVAIKREGISYNKIVKKIMHRLSYIENKLNRYAVNLYCDFIEGNDAIIMKKIYEDYPDVDDSDVKLNIKMEGYFTEEYLDKFIVEEIQENHNMIFKIIKERRQDKKQKLENH